jgi:two-component system chemotaxis response regulator CheY
MKTKIMIVDDAAVARRILKSCIPKAEEYEFYEAEDGEEAIEIFNKIEPELTFLDINMPKLDGLDCLEQIKRYKPEACVVMCSGDIQPRSLDKANELGAFCVIKKPPTREIVQATLVKAWEAYKK